MLRLKDFLKAVDENTFCKITDISGKILLEPLSIFELSITGVKYFEYHIIHCYIRNNHLIIMLDLDIII